MLDFYLSNCVADRVVGKNVKKPVWKIFDKIRSNAIREMACPMMLQVIVSSKLSSEPAFLYVQKCDVNGGGWQYNMTAAGFIATEIADNSSLWSPITKMDDPQLSRYEQGLALLNIRRAVQLTLCSVLGILKPDLRNGQQNFIAHAVDTQDGTHGLIFHLETDSDLSRHFLPQGNRTLTRLQFGDDLDNFLRENCLRSSPWLLLAVNLLSAKYE